MATLRVPSGLGSRGRQLWRDLTEVAEFNPAERVLLEEACRIADRLDKLDGLLTGDAEDWLNIVEAKGYPDRQEVVINAPLAEARQQANVLKQLIAALRLPDDSAGRRPQQRGGARGAYKPSAAKAGTVTSLRDRIRKSG